MEQKALSKWLKPVLPGLGICSLAVDPGILPGVGEAAP